jgi:hypothetical protein
VQCSWPRVEHAAAKLNGRVRRADLAPRRSRRHNTTLIVLGLGNTHTGPFYFTQKIKNFSVFLITSNLIAHAQSIKYMHKVLNIVKTKTNYTVYL